MDAGCLSRRRGCARTRTSVRDATRKSTPRHCARARSARATTCIDRWSPKIVDYFSPHCAAPCAGAHDVERSDPSRRGVRGTQWAEGVRRTTPHPVGYAARRQQPGADRDVHLAVPRRPSGGAAEGAPRLLGHAAQVTSASARAYAARAARRRLPPPYVLSSLPVHRVSVAPRLCRCASLPLRAPAVLSFRPLCSAATCSALTALWILLGTLRRFLQFSGPIAARERPL